MHLRMLRALDAPRKARRGMAWARWRAQGGVAGPAAEAGRTLTPSSPRGSAGESPLGGVTHAASTADEQIAAERQGARATKLL